MTYYSRKSPRIQNYDYCSENYYFITICTHNRGCIFGSPDRLNAFGKIAEDHIKNIDIHYQNVHIDKYVIMPNHVHLIIVLDKDNQADLQQIIGQYKSGVAREIRKDHPNMSVWQRSFHDHVIRSQNSYEKIWLYIEGNPQSWDKDCFFIDQQISNR